MEASASGISCCGACNAGHSIQHYIGSTKPNRLGEWLLRLGCSQHACHGLAEGHMVACATPVIECLRQGPMRWSGACTKIGTPAEQAQRNIIQQ